MRMFRSSMIAALCVCMLFTVSCTRDDSSEASDDISGATDYAPLVSAAVQVVKAPLRAEYIGSGVIEGVDEAVLRTRIGGVIESVDFELGDILEQGEVIMHLDDRVSQLNVSQLRQQYENSQKNVESSEKLFDRGSISESQLAQARAARDGLEAQLAQAEDALENTEVRTPISGSVAEKSAALVMGDLISAGQQIGRVIDLENLRVRLSIGQEQLFMIRKGHPARIEIKTPTGMISSNGIVSAVSAGSDARTGSWTVLIDFKNPRIDVVRAGVSAEVTIRDPDAERFTIVPNAAMVYRGGKTYVFIVENGTARMIEVYEVDQYGDHTAVTSLEQGIDLLEHKVLVSGLSKIEEGSATVTE